MMNAALPNDPAALKDLLLKQQRAHLERTVLLQSQLENMAAQTSAFQTRIEVLEQKEQQFAQRMTELQRKNDDLTVDKLRLEYRLMVLLKRYYGPRADKIGTGQMLLEFAELLEQKPLEAPKDAIAECVPATGGDAATAGAVVESRAVVAPTRHIRKGRRDVEAMKHLPTQQCIHDLPESEKACPVTTRTSCPKIIHIPKLRGRRDS